MNDRNSAEVARLAGQITDPDQIERIADNMMHKAVEQFSDFEPISFYFKRAIIETWPKAAQPGGFEEMMERMAQVMQAHHEHLIHIVYGDHPYQEEVRDLIYGLAKNIYLRIHEKADPTAKVEYTQAWLTAAEELGVPPGEMKNHDYLCWVHKRVSRETRERQAAEMGVDPDTVEPYDYELWLFGKSRRR